MERHDITPLCSSCVERLECRNVILKHQLKDCQLLGRRRAKKLTQWRYTMHSKEQVSSLQWGLRLRPA